MRRQPIAAMQAAGSNVGGQGADDAFIDQPAAVAECRDPIHTINPDCYCLYGLMYGYRQQSDGENGDGAEDR